MIVTTTPNIEGKHVTRYLGLVTGQTILGTGRTAVVAEE